MIGSWSRPPPFTLLVLTLLAGCGDSKSEVATQPSEDAGASITCGRVDSTFAAIQRSIFEQHGCTSKGCHGREGAQAELNLTADVSYRSIVDVASRGAGASASWPRILPGGSRRESLLYLKLAAATHGQPLPSGTGAPMPAGGAAPVPEQKLEALALWILAGAPEQGVVKGTETLLDCELPEAAPTSYTALEPPPPADGFQLRAPGWALAASGEDEVCFATYYDLTDSAPAEAVVDCPEDVTSRERSCVAYGDALMTQAAQSHHSTVYAYVGASDANEAIWGAWSCLGGELAGMSCDPKRPAVAAREGGGDCGPRSGCTTTIRSAPGCVGWGAPDFTTKRRTIGGAQTARAAYPQPEGVYGVIPRRGLIVWNSHGFNLTREASTVAMSLNMRYAKSTSRRYLYRSIFDDGDLITPLVPPFSQREFCRTLTLPRGSRLQFLVGHMHKRGTLFRIWDPPRSPCSAKDPHCVAASEPPIYTSRHYNDQTVLAYDTPRAFDQESADERTLLYCALYDNGSVDAATVKRKSTSPKVPGGFAPGGPCADADLVCLGGDRQGERCGGAADACTGGGVCDACPLKGGATTEDEMLLLMGGYHVAEPGP